MTKKTYFWWQRTGNSQHTMAVNDLPVCLATTHSREVNTGPAPRAPQRPGGRPCELAAFRQLRWHALLLVPLLLCPVSCTRGPTAALGGQREPPARREAHQHARALY